MEALLLVPLAGLVGSFHCAGMCGPFVAWYTARSSGSAWRAHGAYHGGRLIAYLAVGTLAGTIGQGFLFLAETVNLQKVLAIMLGISMISVGVIGLIGKSLGKPGRVRSWLTRRMYGLIGTSRGNGSAAMVGLCSTLLPCGFLYAFALSAAATGNPFSAVLTMAGFWLGTMPALLGMGLITRLASQHALARIGKLTPVFLIIFGLLAISGKWVAMTAPVGSQTHCFGF